MTNEERREAVAKLLKNAPDVLTSREVAKWSRYGRNTVYAMLKDGTFHGYVCTSKKETAQAIGELLG